MIRTRFTKYLCLTLSMGIIPSVTFADDLALVITNGNYGSGVATRPVTLRHNGLVEAYQDQGYAVIEGKNVSADDLQTLLTDFIDQVDGKDRVVVHLSGQLAHFGQQGWFLPVDVRGDSLSEIAFGAPTTNLMLTLLADHPGRSAFIAALYAGNGIAEPLAPGLGELDIPQGVLVLSGAEDEVNDVVLLELLSSDASVAEVLANKDRLKISGFVSPDMSFATPPVAVDTPTIIVETATATVEPTPSADAEEDRTAYLEALVLQNALWATAVNSNLIADYQEYLRQYPTGLFAESARAKVIELDVPEPPSAEELEQELNLSRNSRRTIQENLTYLGHDTNGIDGIFGTGSRAAIVAWQRAEDIEITGYLTAEQIIDLQDKSDALRLKTEREDRDYWAATGDNGGKTELQLYLDRYANGIFAAEARAKLRTIEREEREAADREAWVIADELDTIAAYQSYLSNHRNGIYAEVAQARLVALEADAAPEADVPTPDTDVARAAEQRLNLNAGTRLLIEGRLRGLGFNPGNVDGSFDATTRDAIRSYQASRGLPPTGFLNASTVQALLLG